MSDSRFGNWFKSHLTGLFDRSRNEDGKETLDELRLQSRAVSLSPSGQLSVDISILRQTEKFKRTLKAAEKVKDAYYARHHHESPQ